MLGVLDKEITKPGMSPGFYGVHGLVGKADTEWKLHQCMKRNAFGNIWQQEIRWSGDPGEDIFPPTGTRVASPRPCWGCR